MKKGVISLFFAGFIILVFLISFASAPNETVTTAKEKVKCIFSGAEGEQKCYTEDWKFSCSGTGSCVMEVSGETGAKLIWKTSCLEGVSVPTALDGNDDTIGFVCKEVSNTEIPPAPQEATLYEEVSEQVKCIFLNSKTEQKCYSELNSCTGVENCLADVKGAKGRSILWKSSCGGYKYTTMDGNNEAAEFNCQTSSACTDSDGGINYELKGVTKDSYSEKTDYCINEKELTESFCKDAGDGRGAVINVLENYPCPRGCKDGACLSSPNSEKPILSTPLPVQEPLIDSKNCDSTSAGKTYCQGDRELMTCIAITNMETGKTIYSWAPSMCSFKCSNGNCMDEQFFISSIEGVKKIYYAGEKLNLLMKGAEKDGTPASADEGFNIQFYIDEWPLVYNQGSIGDNAFYKDGYWQGSIRIPNKISTFRLGIYLYCSRDNSYCSKTYGIKGAQVEKTFYFSTIPCKEQSCIVSESCSPSKCEDGTITDCKEIEGKCVCSTCPSILIQPVCGNGICESGEGESCKIIEEKRVSCEEGKECKASEATCSVSCAQDCESKEIDIKLDEKFKLQVSQIAKFENLKIAFKDLIAYKCEEAKMGVVEEQKINERASVAEATITGKAIETVESAETVEKIETVKTIPQATPILKCMGAGPKALLRIDIPQNSEDGKTKQLVINLDLNEKKQVENYAILFLNYDYASRTGVFLLTKEKFSCPERCKCNENGKTIMCAGEACKPGETLCQDGKCREKCEMITADECKYGCIYEGKCFPMGVRSKGLYCSTELIMSSQKILEEACENDFECKANLCVDEKCISPGFLKKIFEWFKGIFG